MSAQNGHISLAKVLAEKLGAAAGHIPQTACAEIIDNGIDAYARNITCFINNETRTLAFYDDGEGITQLENVLGMGSDLKIKSSDKIGHFMTGLLSAISCLQPDTVRWLTRQNNSPKDMTMYFGEICTLLAEMTSVGTTNEAVVTHIVKNDDKHVKKFNSDTIEAVMTLLMGEPTTQTQQYPLLQEFLSSSSTQSGTLIVLNFAEHSKEFINNIATNIRTFMDIWAIKDYNKFIRENNLFIQLIDLNHGDNYRCDPRGWSVLGRHMFLTNEDLRAYDEEGKEYISIGYGAVNPKKVLVIKSEITKDGISSKILNSFTEKCKKGYLIPHQTNIYGDAPNATFNVYVSCISDADAEAQREALHEHSKEDMKYIHVEFNGKVLKVTGFPQYFKGLAGRNLMSVRCIISTNSSSMYLFGVQSNKNQIDLNSCHPGIQEWLKKIVKSIYDVLHRQSQVKDPRWQISNNNTVNSDALGVNDWSYMMPLIDAKITGNPPPSIVLAPTPTFSPSPSPDRVPVATMIHPSSYGCVHSEEITTAPTPRPTPSLTPTIAPVPTAPIPTASAPPPIVDYHERTTAFTGNETIKHIKTIISRYDDYTIHQYKAIIDVANTIVRNHLTTDGTFMAQLSELIFKSSFVSSIQSAHSDDEDVGKKLFNAITVFIELDPTAINFKLYLNLIQESIKRTCSLVLNKKLSKTAELDKYIR